MTEITFDWVHFWSWSRPFEYLHSLLSPFKINNNTLDSVKYIYLTQYDGHQLGHYICQTIRTKGCCLQYQLCKQALEM